MNHQHNCQLYHTQNGSLISLWRMEPLAWIQAASEIRHAVKSSEAEDLFLFMNGPASLALMAGDALGLWAGKRIAKPSIPRRKHRTSL